MTKFGELLLKVGMFFYACKTDMLENISPDQALRLIFIFHWTRYYLFRKILEYLPNKTLRDLTLHLE
jgi:hypothetical protein